LQIASERASSIDFIDAHAMSPVAETRLDASEDF
jgi:hypothetical protein